MVICVGAFEEFDRAIPFADELGGGDGEALIEDALTIEPVDFSGEAIGGDAEDWGEAGGVLGEVVEDDGGFIAVVALPDFGEEVAEGVGLGEVFGVTVVGVAVECEDFGGGEGGVVGVGAEEDSGVFLDGFVAVVGVGVAKVLDEVGFGELGVLGEKVEGEFAPAAEGAGVVDRLDGLVGVA